VRALWEVGKKITASNLATFGLTADRPK